MRWHVQATRFVDEANHQRKVQLFFTITLTLLEHQLLNLKQKCSPAALAADPRTDVEAMFNRIANAIKVSMHQTILALCIWSADGFVVHEHVHCKTCRHCVSCCLVSVSEQELCLPCCYSICSCSCVVYCMPSDCPQQLSCSLFCWLMELVLVCSFCAVNSTPSLQHVALHMTQMLYWLAGSVWAQMPSAR